MNKCPKCLTMADRIEVQELESPLVRNSLSRTSDEYICNLCGKAEGFADYLDMTFEMARVAIEQDWQEARRLPPGLNWGTLYLFPTGGLHDSD